MAKFRTLIIKGAEWSYRIGRSAAVLVDPRGRKQTVRLNVLTGRSWDELERGRRKGGTDGMVTPGDVRRYIEKQAP